MALTLDDQECTALTQALDYYLPQLRRERAAAEARETQHALSILESALERLRSRLESESSPARPPAL